MTDKSIQQAVEQELDWEPRVNAAHVGVSAKDGAVTLTGDVPTYSEKIAARKAAERVLGVRAVANEIQVRLAGEVRRDDSEIAENASRQLEWHDLVPQNVRAEVQNGHITLIGEVEWPYQRREAQKAVRNLRGSTGVTNQITVKPRVQPTSVEDRIMAAFKRNASLDAKSIKVSVSDGTVLLRGKVHSLAERRAARAAADSAPGVAYVEDDLIVVP